MNDSDDIVKEFLVESYENLDRLDRDLVTLEKNPNDREILGSIFRTIHTIKGTSGFLAFNKLGAVAHVGESLLGLLRDGQKALDRDITSALLAMVDAVRQILASIEATGVEGERDDDGLISRLTRLQGVPEAVHEIKTPGAKTQEVEAPEVAVQEVKVQEIKAQEEVKAQEIEAAPVTESASEAAAVLPNNIGDILMQQAGVTSAEIVRAAEEQKAGDPRHLGEILVEQGAARPADVVDALRAQAARGQSASDSTIRLDVSLLDQLMNLVGELVLARNQILQFANRSADSGLLVTSQRLNLITTELQGGVMKTRMQPIGNIWSKLPRTVRDLAVACGKQVRVEMEGKETELDKTLIEAIKDPLTHIVRNSVDHGIETPEARQAAGKDPEGRLFLRAFHEGGQVNIEISDDGAGLDQERIRNKAVQKGLISAEQASRMSDRELVNLVFLPGFSTAEKITNVSGRGVGMDVVKTHIEKIGGTVDLQSKPGQGVMVRMKIPLTLAIIPALVVTCGGDRYAIPQVSLLELVRLEADEVTKGIEMVQGAPVHRLRGRLLPLVYLSRELQLAGVADLRSEEGNAVNIVVLQAEGRQFGLVVDEINDTEEIVVKPLGKQLKGVNTFAGATIMGDGKVALILDALGLAQKADVISELQDRGLAGKEPSSGEKTAGNRQTLLLFQTGKNGRMAIPLSLVARLEEFEPSKVESAGQRQVVQYRGQIMPLIRISEAVGQPAGGPGEMAADAEARLQVVVYAEGGRSIGLVVERILDIVEEDVVLDRTAERAGILGSAVVQQRVTDLLDVQGVVRAANPRFFTATAAG
ncbi:MAG: chemotaxis protein CheA [Terriglobales bacterium]|jgi:two-component system chemotaxis sensor kinase CheA